MILILLLGSVAACDTGEDTKDGIVGSWTVESYVTRQMVRASQTQAIVDLTRPPEGSLVVSGAESATLRYVRSYTSAYNDYRSAVITSFNPSEPPPNDFYTLDVLQQVRDGELFHRLHLLHSADGATTSYHTFAQSDPYLFSGSNTQFTLNTDITKSDATQLVHI